jgi:rhamnose utilization protein RhaD (predicted bifunctional aldolase and dehydrogenase)/NAD(P)-dependent dehydrogenase (short-subunit alcohol dehydrogenase family)
MAGIEVDDFTGLNLAPLRRLRQLTHISDEEMDNQLKINKLRADAPDPSVEALLHVFLPHKFIIHTHADAILALTNRTDAVELIKKTLGPAVCIIPYEKSGLPLALSALSAWEKNPEAKTIIVLHHGIFTFAADAKTAYLCMENCIKKAETWLEKQKPEASNRSVVVRDHGLPARIAQVIRGACAGRDNPDHIRALLVDIRDRHDIIEVSLSKKAREICETGVLTPDHAIRTKNRYVHIDYVPDTDEELADMIARQVDKFKKAYKAYFKSFQTDSGQTPLDPAPRVFLVAGVGLFALGETKKAARIAGDIAEHNILTKYRTGLESFSPIDEAHVFDMEYWPLQQKKLRSSAAALLEGKIALVTGAAGAIGFGIADRLLAAGAVVVISDIDETGLETVREILARRYGDDRLSDVCFDVTDEQGVKKGVEAASLKFGGIDILVPNAGTAHVASIENLDSDIFQRVVSVNLMGTFYVIKSTIPVFRRQKTGGNIVVISTKNVFDPGASFGAYSASKAGTHQIGKIAALELAELGVRVNMVNPDAVFGDKTVPSKLWEMIGPDRMKARGLDPEGLKEYYRQRNLLKVPVSAQHVGNAVVFFAAGLTPTTGASLPVDGGVPAAFPR